MARAIRDYYTRDQYQECLEAWRSLSVIEQSEHILAQTPFRAQVIQAQETERQEVELQGFLQQPGWPVRDPELIRQWIKGECDI